MTRYLETICLKTEFHSCPTDMKVASDDQQMKGVNVTRKPLGLNLCDVGDEEQSIGV